MANVLAFQQNKVPRPRTGAQPTSDTIRYFTEQQIRLIRRTARDRANVALARGQVTAVRDWMLIDLLTSTGLRESEAADLRCGDLRLGYGQSAVFVRDGKCHKSGTVQIPASLKVHLSAFLRWKDDQDEPTGPDDHLFIGQRGPWSGWAVGSIVKTHLRRLGLDEPGKSAHALRHSYAVALYRREHDLRAVQRQLRHASIQTTQVYASVLPDDIARQIKGMWG